MPKTDADGMTYVDKAEFNQIAKEQSALPGREEFKRMPGYYERPAKVMRTGVGMVDGYEWGVSANAANGEESVRKHHAAVGELMATSWRMAARRQLNTSGVEPPTRMRIRATRRYMDGQWYARVGCHWIPGRG